MKFFSMLHAVPGRDRFVQFPRADIERSIVSRFGDQVERYGDRTALCWRCGRLSYDELDVITDRVASELQQILGREPSLVALLLPYEQLPIGMLAVLKAGMFFITLDNHERPQRQSTILRDCGAKAVLTNSTLQPRIIARIANTLCIDTLPVAGGYRKSADTTLSADSLACVHYTSGSTNTPKQVVYTHRTVMHMIMDNTHSLGIGAEDKIASFGACAFVGTTASIFRALLNGACIYLLDLKSEPELSLADWLNEHQIDLAQMVPTTFRHLTNSLRGDQMLHALRVLHLAGEPVRDHEVQLFKRHCTPGTWLVNELGTTETGAIARLFVNHDSEPSQPRLSVGWPVVDKRVWLADDHGQEVARGVVGEIMVESVFLSHGYRGHPRPASTAFGSAFAGTCYATGDLGIFNDNATLTHLGRLDQRIKIRGHNVDPLEVESAMLRSGYFREVVVTPHDKPNGNTQLVAHELPADVVPSVNRIRACLEDLPNYMIPTCFNVVKSFPLTVNGKIDRRALAKLDVSRAATSTPSVAPRFPLERVLVRLWRECLGINNIGIYDNFYEFGVDSLDALQVTNALHARTGIKVTMKQFFNTGNIARLSERISETGQVGDEQKSWRGN